MKIEHFKYIMEMYFFLTWDLEPLLKMGLLLEILDSQKLL